MKNNSIKKNKSDILTEEDKRLERILSVTMERHIGALTEEFQSRVEVIGEQFGGIMRKLEEHDDRFEQIDRKLKEHDNRFEQIDRKLKEHDDRFEKIEKTLDSHTEMIGTIMVDTTDIKDSLTQKVDKKEFNQTINSIKVALASK